MANDISAFRRQHEVIGSAVAYSRENIGQALAPGHTDQGKLTGVGSHIIKQGDTLAVGQIDINHHNIDIVFPKTAQRLCAVVDTQHDNAEGL